MEIQLRELRKKSHMSQTDLAKAIGASLRTVGSWERGESLPSAEQVWNCAVALHTTPNDLLGWYIDHPQDRPAAPPGDPAEAALVGAYRDCAPQWKEQVLMSARAAAGMSKEAAERPLDAAAGGAA